MSNFIDLCLAGDRLVEDVDDFVEEWHEGSSENTLRDALGMSQREYDLWALDESMLNFIIVAHRDNKDIDDVINGFYAVPMAARGNFANALELTAWLKEQGHLN